MKNKDKNKIRIALLVRKVNSEMGSNQSSICATDCLFQWSMGGDALLEKTISAWGRHLEDKKNNNPLTMTIRHGLTNGDWVPAIPYSN